MAFCKYTSTFLIDHYTLVDNLFIHEYLPFADENAVRVYLYGLYLCSNPIGHDNSIESMASVLGLTAEDVLSCFRYWENAGLVQLSQRAPFEVNYLPVKTTFAPPKKFKPEKYGDFTTELQKLFPDRMLTPNEYNEYLSLIESRHIEPAAMLMIAQYCINLKGADVRFPYVLAVAKDWAQSGIHTFRDVEERIQEHERTSDEIVGVLKALGKKASGDISDREFFIKWTKNWGFEYNAVVFAAKKLGSRGNMKRLDALLDEYYRLNIFSTKEMEEYQAHKDELYALTREVNKIIGVYYESLDYIVETYVNQWCMKGFDGDAIKLVAQYCFKRSIRTLEGVNKAINKFYALGLVTTSGINKYLDTLLVNDNAIAEILKTAGSERNVNNVDREYYNTWTSGWGFTDEMILLAAKGAQNKTQPLAYINQILSRWRENKIYTPEKANFTPTETKKATGFEHRDYTSEELKAFFTNIEDDIEV